MKRETDAEFKATALNFNVLKLRYEMTKCFKLPKCLYRNIFCSFSFNFAVNEAFVVC